MRKHQTCAVALQDSHDPLGLMLPLDHAEETNNTQLAKQIRLRAVARFSNDVDCPLHWEPDGRAFFTHMQASVARLSRPKPIPITFLTEASPPIIP